MCATRIMLIIVGEHNNKEYEHVRPKKNETQITHLADSVLIEPVTSISPARNNWYLVQAMLKEL